MSVSDLFALQFAHGSWFQFPVMYLRLMPPAEAILLTELTEHSDACKASLRDGWFPCPVKIIESKLCMSPDVQGQLLQSLQKLNIVQSELRGTPAKLHVRIDYTNLENLILAR